MENNQCKFVPSHEFHRMYPDAEFRAQFPTTCVDIIRDQGIDYLIAEMSQMFQGTFGFRIEARGHRRWIYFTHELDYNLMRLVYGT